MTVTLDIPDDLASAIGGGAGDVRRAVLEGFAVEAYRSGRLSCAEVRQLLGLASRWEAEDFLSRHGAWPDPSVAEIEADLRVAESFRRQ